MDVAAITVSRNAVPEISASVRAAPTQRHHDFLDTLGLD
jgi:hypothetical protein